MGAPAGRTCNDKQRREHRRRHAHHVITRGAIPIEVREHFFLAPHDFFYTSRNVVELHIACFFRELARDFFDDDVARIGNGVNRMTEADDDLLFRDALNDVRFGLVGVVVAADGVKREFIGAAVLRAF